MLQYVLLIPIVSQTLRTGEHNKLSQWSAHACIVFNYCDYSPLFKNEQIVAPGEFTVSVTGILKLKVCKMIISRGN